MAQSHVISLEKKYVTQKLIAAQGLHQPPHQKC